MAKPSTLTVIPPARNEAPPGLGDNFLKQLRIKIDYKALRDLVPRKRNPRTHSDKQIAQLRAAIQQFGIVLPVVVDKGGVIWNGDAVCRAAGLEGYDEVPTVDISHLDEQQRRMFALAVNKISDNAGWDDNLLSLELADLKGLGMDVENIGFNEAELSNLLKSDEPDPSAPEPPKNPVSRHGDIWQLGPHRLACGDCTKEGDVVGLLETEKPPLMATDPPYGVDYDPKWRDGITRANGTTARIVGGGKVKNDDKADWSEAWKLFPGDVAYVWHADKTAWEVEGSLRAVGFEKRATIVWDKGKAPISQGHYHFQHECAFYVVRNGRKGNWNGDRKQSTVWAINSNTGFEAKKDEGTGDEHTSHGTQKPVECMKRPILNNTSKGDSVYDPFVGSGTTIIAAERTGRRAFAMDIDPAYVDVSILRWEKETGRQAVLISTGKSYEEMKSERLSGAPAS